MTHTELAVTHIYEVSPRGFANEVIILPITRRYERVAAEWAEEAANDTSASGSLYSWDEAPPSLRQKAGLILREVRTAEELEEMLAAHFLAIFAYDPEAFDMVNGQWVRRAA